MFARPTWNTLGLVLALAVAGCGEDGKGHDHDDHEHGQEPDGGYPDVPCDPSLPPLAVGSEQLGSDTMLIKAKLVSSDPLPLLKGSADWVVDFTTPDGAPITDLEFTDVFTYMPSHAHYGNFKPRSKALAEPGRYEFDNFNFTMRGPWQVRFEVNSPTVGADYVIFNVCVEPE